MSSFLGFVTGRVVRLTFPKPLKQKDFPNSRGAKTEKKLAFLFCLPYGESSPGESGEHAAEKDGQCMENKKTFGAYICRCRKGLGLTQREFADKLFVTESAVSKWERGLSYPDITLIRDICAVLGVTEHELLTASEDVETRNAETLAKKYLALLRRVRWTQGILYGGTALICLICNLAVDHTLDWFWLVLTGELAGASLTLLPVMLRRYRCAAALGGFTLSLELLLLAACLYSGGDWFWMAATATLFGLGAIFLPVVLRELPRPLSGHKAVLYLGAETLLLSALLWAAGSYSGADWFPVPALPGALFGLAFPWGWALILRYAPMNIWWRRGACLGWGAILLPLVNPVLDRLVVLGGGTVERLHRFWFQADFSRWGEDWYYNENVLLIFWLCLMGAAALCVARALWTERKVE